MILKVKVYLDDNVPNYMEGIFRCGSVIVIDEKNNEINRQELIDNTEYHSIEDLKNDIARRLKVNMDTIEVIQ